MGKNSKAKRDLKKKKSNNKSREKSPGKGNRSYEDVIPKIKDNLISVYKEYNLAELFLTLSISELWLPNISSPVKHTIAFNTLLSMDVSTFNNQKELKTYQQASEFFSIIYKILPNIPQMEDFVPEQDWGQIKIPWGDNIYRIFTVAQSNAYMIIFKLLELDTQNIQLSLSKWTMFLFYRISFYQA